MPPAPSKLIYQLHSPRTTTPGAVVPLVVLIHGRGSNENDLPGLIPQLDDRCRYLSVRAPFELAPGAFTWYDLQQIGDPEPETFRQSLDLLGAFVDEATEQYSVGQGNVILVGFSQGAVMSLSLLLTAPQKVAGVIAMSGYVPLSMNLAEQRDQLLGRAVLITHGIHDSLIPIDLGREARDYLGATAVDLTYREYPMGHQVTAESLADVSAWLRAQVDRLQGGIPG